MAKPTSAQKKLRIRAVYEMLLSNYPRPDILQYCAEKWGVKERGADNYIAEATTLIEQEASKHQEHFFQLNLQQRHYLHNKAVKDGDWRLAHEIVKDEAKLLGLYPADKLKILDWQDELLDLLKQGKITPADVTDELGADLAQKFFQDVGLVIVVADEYTNSID